MVDAATSEAMKPHKTNTTIQIMQCCNQSCMPESRYPLKYLEMSQLYSYHQLILEH